MKVLWLFPPSMREGEFPLVSQNRWFKYIPEQTNNIYPILAAYGMTMIQNDGHQMEFIDAPTLGYDAEKLKYILEKVQYDVIIMEGRTAIINHVLEWARIINVLSPEAKVALYGDHVMVEKTRITRLVPGVDYIIDCGDYDWGAYGLVKNLEWETPLVRSKIFPRSLMTERDLDMLPFVDRELVPWEKYFEAWRHRGEFGWVQSQRGCFDRCTFCSWNHIFWGCTVRSMSPSRVADEYGFMKEKYGIREVLDDSDTFYEEWGRLFARELLDRGVDMYWNVQTRADEIKVDYAWGLMKKAGLHVVKIGADGGSDLTLNKIAKGHTIEDTRRAVKTLKALGLEVHINMILGFPWESKKESYDVIRFVKSLKPNQAQFSLIQPFPGTPLYEQAVREGWLAVGPSEWDRWNMKEPILQGEMSTEEIKALHRDSWAMFYLDPSFILGQLWKSTKLALDEKSFDSFRHLWRGFRGVRQNMKAME